MSIFNDSFDSFHERLGNSSGVPESNSKRTWYSEDQILKAAKEAYEVTRAYEFGLGSAREPWQLAPHWSKSSAIESVQYIIENPTVADEQLHSHWISYKLETGWIWGETYDIELATHPCLVPFSELSPETLIKLQLFKGTVKRMLEITL